MTTRRRALAGAALSSALLLTACGGGGGDNGGTPPPLGGSALRITSTNYVRVSQEAVATAFYVADSAGFVTGAQVADEALLMRTVRTQLLRLPKRFGAATPRPVGAVITESEDCSGGGSVTIALDDTNNDQDISAGETARLTFANCIELGVRVGGAMTVRLDTLSGNLDSNVFAFSATATLENFAVTASGVSASGNGQIRVAINSTGFNAQTSTVDVTNLTTTVNLGNETTTRTAISLRVTDQTSPSGGSWIDTLSISGTVSSTALEARSITIATVTPFTVAANALYPHTGRATFTGESGSSVRLTAQSATQVLLELDADGNGLYEASTLKNWSELR